MLYLYDVVVLVGIFLLELSLRPLLNARHAMVHAIATMGMIDCCCCVGKRIPSPAHILCHARAVNLARVVIEVVTDAVLNRIAVLLTLRLTLRR